jgi:predicted ATP-dependent serine protease
LKLECQDCGIESEDVSDHCIQSENYQHFDLCVKCYRKRNRKTGPEEETNDAKPEEDSPPLKELGEIDVSTPEKCQEIIRKIEGLQESGRLGPATAATLIRSVKNAMEAHKIPDA